MTGPADDSGEAATARATVDLAVLARFRFAIRKFLAFSEAAANAAGLTAQQHQALLAIEGFGGGEGLTVGGVAERLMIRHHTAGELVTRMEGAALVVRRPDPRDARRALVVVTEEGRARLKSLSGAHLQELQTIGPELVAALEALQ